MPNIVFWFITEINPRNVDNIKLITIPGSSPKANANGIRSKHIAALT